jgi:acyl carrier protein
MNRPQDLEQRVSQLVGATVQIPLTAENYDQDLHLDSMAILELIVGLEKEFGIQVDEAKMDLLNDFRSVATISQFVLESLNSKESGNVAE